MSGASNSESLEETKTLRVFLPPLNQVETMVHIINHTSCMKTPQHPLNTYKHIEIAT